MPATLRIMHTTAPECHGTRDELAAELHRMSEGWYHLAKDRLADAARRGAAELEAGASSVRVGHTRYVVTK